MSQPAAKAEARRQCVDTLLARSGTVAYLTDTDTNLSAEQIVRVRERAERVRELG